MLEQIDTIMAGGRIPPSARAACRTRSTPQTRATRQYDTALSSQAIHRQAAS